MSKRIFQGLAVAVGTLTVAAMLAGCSKSEPSAAVTPSPSATPTVYPVPDGCPPAKELGQAWVKNPDWFTAIDAKLLDTEVKTPLPKGGCAYLYDAPGTSNNSSDKYQRVMVWYFNLDRSGRPASIDIVNWAKSAGGTPSVGKDPITNQTTTPDTTGRDFDLPVSFTGWTGGTAVLAGEGSSFGWDDSVLPAYTQGNQAKLDFAMSADKAQAMVRASGSGASSAAAASDSGSVDPTKSLAQGLAATFSTSIGITDDQGYTVQLKVQGKLQPFTKDVTDAPPGKLNAVSSATVSGSVTNTTDGRNTEAPGASVMAVYPLNSAACLGSNGISVKGADWQKSSYCALDLGSVESATLSPGGSQDLKGTTTPQKLGTFPEAGDSIAQLNSPVSVYLAFGSAGSISTGTSSHGDKGCLAQRMYGGATWDVAMDGWPDVICK